jgi:hypothetical protein
MKSNHPPGPPMTLDNVREAPSIMDAWRKFMIDDEM